MLFFTDLKRRFCYFYRCKNGVLLLFLQMSLRKDPSSVRIREVLLEMRRYRMGLIQTPDQLRFSYLAVIEGAKYIKGDTSLQARSSSSLLSFFKDVFLA